MFINIYVSTVVPLGGVMISMLASIVVDHGFNPRSGQTRDYKINIVASPLSMQH